VTGWRPPYSLRDGMAKTIGSMREKAPRGIAYLL
jgi:hypothetical protein